MKTLPLLLALAAVAPTTCHACATVSADLDEEVRTTDESALIVWDSKTGTEHFIRQANFQTRAKNFGFLVPTPSKPELASTNGAIFQNLQRELLPKTKVEVQRGVKFTTFFSFSGSGDEESAVNAAATNAAASSEDDYADVPTVEVIEQTRVGDYNASVLRASDTAALTRWLSAHRYSVSPDTRDWLEPYVSQGFFITAFQIAADQGSQSAQAGAVRLTFQTAAPFYPYREPKRAQTQYQPRSLGLFFIGDSRVDAQIEDADRKSPWPALVQYSAPLDDNNFQSTDVPLPTAPLHLTRFVDSSSPRPGWGDLNFALAADQSEITPPPNIIHQDGRITVPLDLVVIFLVGIGLWWAKIRNESPSPRNVTLNLGNSDSSFPS